MKVLKVKLRYFLYISSLNIGCFETEQEAMDYAKDKHPYVAPVIMPAELYTYREESE